MTAFRHELRALFTLAWPATVTQVGLMLTGVVDTMVVARTGATALAAAALAHMWMWSTLSLGVGAVMGTDPMISQAHGRGDGEAAALALQRGIVVALLTSVPICVAVALTDPALSLLGQPPEVAALAARYNLLRLPMIPCFLLFSILRLFLQARGRMGPATALIYVANVINALLAWGLVFGELGMPRLGFDGAALAGTATAAFELVGLIAAISWLGLARGAERRWDRASFSPAGIASVLRIGAPVALQMWLEAFAFTFASFMVGWISVEAIGAHQIALNLASLTFMVPLGVSMGASARVGNLIGAGDVVAMRGAVRVALIAGIGVMSFSALGFTLLRSELPRLYTADLAVVALSAQILPLAAAFQLSDGAQVVAGGVLRGMGRPNAAAV
ncbi:MAG TPA: MATE family efflux transporter, partial [Polyangiales bacterium]|nr:MATE family efflux transporter [Polyangiales bacterium]